MVKTKTKIYFFLTIIFIIGFSVCTPFAMGQGTDSGGQDEEDAILKLNDQIALKKLEIDNIQKKIDNYQKNLDVKRQEKVSLANQIEILNNEIGRMEAELDQTKEQIDAANLETQAIILKILDQEDKINQRKAQLAEIIRIINDNDQISYLEIFASNNSFSDFFNQIQYTNQLQSKMQEDLTNVKDLKQDLEERRAEREKKNEELAQLKKVLQDKEDRVSSQRADQAAILSATKKSEKKFQSLLTQAKAEQQAANAEIVSAEKELRKKLAQSNNPQQIVSTGQLMWPVPKNTITTYFHDPDYPYRYIFEHPAIDIRAAQGTPIKAADSGYVSVAKDGGRTGYSYITIIHDNGLSTVYGHVSVISVKADDPVAKGQVIGYSGGTPGTHGAGPLTTGPHLHFEVRLNGIPVDPLGYLP